MRSAARAKLVFFSVKKRSLRQCDTRVGHSVSEGRPVRLDVSPWDLDNLTRTTVSPHVAPRGISSSDSSNAVAQGIGRAVSGIDVEESPRTAPWEKRR